MANGGGGRAPATPRVPPCPAELKCFFGCLVTLLRQMEARERALADERARLLAEIQFLEREQSRRMEIAQDSIQEIRRGTSLKDEMAELLERNEEPEASGTASVELNFESFGNCLSTLADENMELKKKLKEVKSQEELTENSVDHQHSSKDLKADIRKLKQAYKSMVSEKDKEISAICAEKDFAWNQFKSLEKEFRDTCNSKNIEIKRANEAAEKLEKTIRELRLEVQGKDGEIGRLEKTVRELQLEVQEKGGEIGRLQEKVVSAEEDLLLVENELKQSQSLVKNKDAGTDQPESSKRKKGLKETNRNSKRAGPVSREKSRLPNATPVTRDVKSLRKCVSSAKGTRNQLGENSRMHSTEERGQSHTSQKRKRGSYTLSHGRGPSSTRQLARTSASPKLFLPGFKIPKTKVIVPTTPPR